MRLSSGIGLELAKVTVMAFGMRVWLVLCVCGLANAARGQEADERRSVVADGAKLELLADGFEFTEGPAADADGNVYFTDQPNDAIHKWSVEGKLSTFLQPAGRSNGLYFDANGLLWACADGRNELWTIRPDGSHVVQVTGFEGGLLNGPNDLWIHPAGQIYFTDPFYRRPYWPQERGDTQQPSEAVYRYDVATKQVERVATGFKRPNGIVGSVERGLLYVADIGAGKTYRYRIGEGGSLEDRTLFCESGSDGMTMDDEGNVYLTGGQGVTVFSPAGKRLELIAVPEGWSANVTFGGSDRRTLFITAKDSLYAIRMRVAGPAK